MWGGIIRLSSSFFVWVKKGLTSDTPGGMCVKYSAICAFLFSCFCVTCSVTSCSRARRLARKLRKSRKWMKLTLHLPHRIRSRYLKYIVHDSHKDTVIYKFRMTWANKQWQNLQFWLNCLMQEAYVPFCNF